VVNIPHLYWEQRQCLMRVLGIETSCDETACAVVEDGTNILSNVVLSQVQLHSPFAGVVPEIACRAHVHWLVRVVEEALGQAHMRKEGIEAIAVVNRPGLIGALLIGVTCAKALALALDKPLVAVDHLQAHIYAAAMSHPQLAFPFLSMVISGGHTAIYKTLTPGESELLGATTDDAVGESFDKVARVLGLAYPGGPSIAGAARKGDPDAVDFPRPLLGPDSLKFSFSGLKTAVLYHVKGQDMQQPRELSQAEVADIAASFQEAVVDTLVEKALRAVERTGLRQLAVTGGVAANRRLREKLTAAAPGVDVCFPPPELCTDNAAMVAGLAYELMKKGETAPLDLDAFAQV
jgi:N6-L-threonylcarbamoyladenine synthase